MRSGACEAVPRRQTALTLGGSSTASMPWTVLHALAHRLSTVHRGRGGVMEGRSKGRSVCRDEPTLGWVLERADQRSAPTENREQSSMAQLYKGQPTVISVRRSGGSGHLPDRRQSCETLVRT
ncbi:hypothetical protein BN1263180107 [Stenotrophomonas maltophilia]|nr:hypothetical protein BN1263180107 [Stenotrophomonas maltophilia]